MDLIIQISCLGILRLSIFNLSTYVGDFEKYESFKNTLWPCFALTLLFNDLITSLFLYKVVNANGSQLGMP